MSEVVTLKGGFIADEAALRRLWAIEEQGVHFSLRDDGRVRVAPADRLSDDDRVFLREHGRLVLYALTQTYTDASEAERAG